MKLKGAICIGLGGAALGALGGAVIHFNHGRRRVDQGRARLRAGRIRRKRVLGRHAGRRARADAALPKQALAPTLVPVRAAKFRWSTWTSSSISAVAR